MTTTEKRSVIFPAQRAIERASRIPGLRPKRFLTVLFPLWRVKVRATLCESQPYEVLDKFLERAVTECGITTVDGLASFFGLRPSLIRRLLTFLTAIGHVEMRGDVITLTAIGGRSVTESTRYSIKQIEQELLFDAFTCSPLPQSHYRGVPLLPGLVPPERTSGQTFRRLSWQFGGTPFRPGAVADLAALPNRDEFNLPKELTDVTPTEIGIQYLPVYLVRAADADGRDSYLAFSRGAADRDEFVENLCENIPSIRHALDVEPTEDPRVLWPTWVSKLGYEPTEALSELPNGVWRATLGNDAFGAGRKYTLPLLGSYVPKSQHFIQLWCEDTRLRKRAVEARAFSLLRYPQFSTRAEFDEQLLRLSEQLEIEVITVEDMRLIATERNELQAVQVLDSLE